MPADATVAAVLLDLGNVVVFHDNDQLSRELAAACGLAPDEVPMRLRDSGAEARFNQTDGPPELVYEAVAPALGFPGSYSQFAAIWNGIFTPNPAVVPAVAILLAQTRVAILSNTNALHMHHLRQTLPLLGRFEAVFTSYELGLAKPDPAIYRAAVARLGLSVADVAFFDDSPGHVAGAAAAGLRAFVYTDVARFVSDLRSLGFTMPEP
jgi:glucose-1-phosphatase